MCDVLDRVEQRGIERGREEGIEQGKVQGRTEERTEIMRKFYKSGFTVKEIARVLEKTENDVKDILQLV